MYYEFREARQHELDACFELRASCCRMTMTAGFVECEEFRQHDDRARHFGMFRRDFAEQRLVGYVRVAEAFPQSPSLPFLHYLGPQGLRRAQRMLGRLFERHHTVVEAGRLSVSRSAGQILLAKHAADCLTALYGLGFEVPALVSCADNHRSFYETLGFRQVLTDEEIAIPWKRCLASICMLKLPRANPLAHTRLLLMLDAYQRYGAIAYHPGDSDNFAPSLVDPEALDSSSRLALIAAA